MTIVIPHNLPPGASRKQLLRDGGTLYPFYSVARVHHVGAVVEAIEGPDKLEGRPDYTLDQCQQVVDWMNGIDPPLLSKDAPDTRQPAEWVTLRWLTDRRAGYPVPAALRKLWNGA